ncbi:MULTISPECIES: Ppx/GppA phosphatase family protein [unclassified Dialister]|jgi:exopolyphosphatase/guanosine-5'-triphosphate,3'-diphosphate pyrophosphatase|uniref:Ppx/GppA phosphatase family protein n=2 Tax=Dialister TaxID=39948 RepID=UPI0025BD1399|nr:MULTISPECIES: Ppx/GppA phosphatase family protein [unclassified Dialister]MEE0292140.1 Ppx/GppA phosphatase family protein [Dialister sp.]
MMRAIIDIGTNSVRLLLAEKDEKEEWKILKKDLRSTRLGEGMTDKAYIGKGPQERTLKAIEEFAAAARLEGADEIFAYGTSIMRDAANGPAFSDEVTSAVGIPVRILSGKEEAYYSYIGAAGTSGVVTSVVDIGGGSTEICMGFGTDIGMRHSFRLGCVRCSKQFDTTTPRGVAELKKHCFDLFRHTELMQSVKNVKRWIGVGGTVTSMAAMLQELEVYDSAKVQDFVIHQDDVNRMLKKLCAMSYDDKCHLTGLMPERADIIVAGVAILDALMEYFALPEIIVSDRDLSEGLLDADVLKPAKES